MKTQLPSKIKLVEVGPRDGLQNEASLIAVDDKARLIELLVAAGFRNIEVGSFVSVVKIPQMADTVNVFKKIHRKKNIIYRALVPNEEGMQAALDAQVDEVAIFTSPSESFNQKNINCSVKESLQRIRPVIAIANKENIKVRAYVSCVIACPYEGSMQADKVRVLAETLIDMGCYEISLGDTIGVGTPRETSALLNKVLDSIPVGMLAVHFHDTYGQALANILTAMQMGVSTIDSSIAGLGGCPYAKGASGNVATEDVLYMLEGMHIESGIQLTKAIAAGNFISNLLNKPNRSRVAIAKS